ncbi:CBS domain-containing protein [Rhodopseudomonas pseudopalustris]|uniref:CBS domain-containing protein n=1 Tax=Rhodopseudomonas pseudopalustris TaxID=1513892 RepID=UPI003F9748A7
MTPQLSSAAHDQANGRPAPTITTREFLSWFGAQRRGYWIVRHIRRELEEAGLQTIPDFESNYIDSLLTVQLIESATIDNSIDSEILPSTDELVAPFPAITTLVSKDPTYRISKLSAANQTVISVKPESTLAECIGILMLHNFSQLPVMSGERTVHGMLSWQSIGSRLALSNSATIARDFAVPHHEIRKSASLFEAIPIIIANEYVLVRAEDQRISGIITATDLTEQFRYLSEPFLLLAEIENIVRTIIGDRFTAAELNQCRGPHGIEGSVEGPEDLNFGDYIRLLQNPDKWQKVGLAIDRGVFCKELDIVREIRNAVMHFDPEGILDTEVEKLRNFTGFLRQLQTIFPPLPQAH